MKSLSPHKQELPSRLRRSLGPRPLEWEPPDLSRLIHNINSKCAGLKGGAELLSNSPPEEVREILELMVQQATALAEGIAAYRDQRCAKKISKSRER
ncbi:MAG: hypothetical protein HY747_00400 [Elusimicrobia bacterium]|nr:hypothetical protein [Elusimicrobiota bacterium]